MNDQSCFEPSACSNGNTMRPEDPYMLKSMPIKKNLGVGCVEDSTSDRAGCALAVRDEPPHVLSMAARIADVQTATLQAVPTSQGQPVNDSNSAEVHAHSGQHCSVELFTQYARAQAAVLRTSDSLERLPRIDCDAIGNRFLSALGEYCESTCSSGNMSPEDRPMDGVREYYQLLAERKDVFEMLIGRSAQLPSTLCLVKPVEVDLSVNQCTAAGLWQVEGTVVGPAGSALPQLLGSSNGLLRWLLMPGECRWDNEPLFVQPVAAYLRTLVLCGYGRGSELRKGIAGAVCCAQMQQFINHCENADQDSSNDSLMECWMGRMLDEFLDVTDCMIAEDEDRTRKAVQDYWRTGWGDRASMLISERLRVSPADMSNVVEYARLLEREGRYEAAEAIYRIQIDLHPFHAALRTAFSDFLMRLGFSAEASEQSDVAFSLLSDS